MDFFWRRFPRKYHSRQKKFDDFDAANSASRNWCEISIRRICSDELRREENGVHHVFSVPSQTRWVYSGGVRRCKLVRSTIANKSIHSSSSRAWLRMISVHKITLAPLIRKISTSDQSFVVGKNSTISTRYFMFPLYLTCKRLWTSYIEGIECLEVILLIFPLFRIVVHFSLCYLLIFPISQWDQSIVCFVQLTRYD